MIIRPLQRKDILYPGKKNNLKMNYPDKHCVVWRSSVKRNCKLFTTLQFKRTEINDVFDMPP